MTRSPYGDLIRARADTLRATLAGADDAVAKDRVIVLLSDVYWLLGRDDAINEWIERTRP